jgi:hypothetical protein
MLSGVLLGAGLLHAYYHLNMWAEQLMFRRQYEYYH